MKVLFVSEPGDMSSMLFAGLCAYMGTEHVVDDPPHPDRPEGRIRSHEDVGRMLLSDAFALVVVCAERRGPLEPVTELLAQVDRSRWPPLAFVDAAEDTIDGPLTLGCRAYFKRNLVSGARVERGVRILPCPYASTITPHMAIKDREVLVVGTEEAHPDHARALRAAFGDRVRFQARPSGKDGAYLHAIARSRIAVSFRQGLDACAYWEIPSVGSLLISDRSSLCLPHPFQEGKHGLSFFGDSPSSLVAAIGHAIDHPEQAHAMAVAGRVYLDSHHTARRRAEYVVNETLRGG